VPDDTPRTITSPLHIPQVDFMRVAATSLHLQATPQVLTTDEPDLPLANTQTGNVFKDQKPDIVWYLPAFQLVDDVDAAFAFTASPSGAGVDAAGNPYYAATISLGLKKVLPDDVKPYNVLGSTTKLKEIPLNQRAATLTIASNDPVTGQPKPTAYPGTVTDAADGGLTLTFKTVLGVGVIIAYENLKNGGATVALTANYDVVRPQRIIFHLPIGVISRPPIGVVGQPHNLAALPVVAHVGPALIARGGPDLPEPVRPIAPVRPIGPIGPIRVPPHPVDGNGDDPPPSTTPAPNFIRSSQQFNASLPLGSKFGSVGYALKFTVSDGTTTKAITSVDDLKSFNTQQSEFSEFTALGDVSIKYPSFERLYIGALSRVIVAVPARYGILRGGDGTAAVCRAVLDPSGATGAAKFEFAFTLVPVISPIELVQLSKDVSANPASRDCTVTLPKRLDAAGFSTVATAFQTSSTFSPGDRLSSFALAVEISDAGGAALAVANANLFIKQLVASVEPYLTGRIGLKLDDFYKESVDADVVLNFAVTGGSDEIAYRVDATSGSIDLTNTSPLDLSLSRYAIVDGVKIDVQTFAQPLLAGKGLTLPTAATGASPSILVERTLQLESPMTKTATARYLQFQVQDVQAVQYQMAVFAADVDFSGRNITQIDVAITLDDLPSVSVPSFSLTALNRQGSQQVAIPIMNALSSLKATVSFTAHFVDTTKPPLQFTLANDFIDTPALLLKNSQIPPTP